MVQPSRLFAIDRTERGQLLAQKKLHREMRYLFSDFILPLPINAVSGGYF